MQFLSLFNPNSCNVPAFEKSPKQVVPTSNAHSVQMPGQEYEINVDGVYPSYSLGPRAVTGAVQVRDLTGGFGAVTQFYMSPDHGLSGQARLMGWGTMIP